MQSKIIILLKYLAFTLSLYIAEVLVFVVIAESVLLFTEHRFNLGYIRDTFIFSVWFNLIRFIYYYPIQILPFIWLISEIRSKKRVLKIAILNCVFYIFISLLYGFIFIPETKEYFTKAFFYTFIVATFASPFILNKIPYYKKLIASMKGATPSPATPVVEEEVENPVEDFVIPKKNITLSIVLKYLLFTLALFIVEALVFTAESMFFVHKHHFHLPYMWDMVLFCINFSATKFMFYFSLQVIPFICLMSEVDGERRGLQLAVINGGLYIIVSLVHAFILTPDTRAYFSEGFFYIFILATFASPFILTQIPYFKKLALELQQPHAPHMFKRFLDLLLKSA